MRNLKLAAALALGISAIGLSGCATGFPAQVSRYQALPAPQGQSFVVVPFNPGAMGGLEFSRYANMVSQGLQAQGYVPAASIASATMVVRLGYGVDNGTTEYESYGDPFYGSGGYFGASFGRPYYSRFGYYGGRSPFYYGWGDPFFGSSFGYSGVSSYTVYKSFVDMDIRRRVDNASLFEGHAKARSQSDNLGILVPNLIEAMFTGFPGRSGETVRITVPSQPRARAY